MNFPAPLREFTTPQETVFLSFQVFQSRCEIFKPTIWYRRTNDVKTWTFIFDDLDSFRLFVIFIFARKLNFQNIEPLKRLGRGPFYELLDSLRASSYYFHCNIMTNKLVRMLFSIMYWMKTISNSATCLLESPQLLCCSEDIRELSSLIAKGIVCYTESVFYNIFKIILITII